MRSGREPNAEGSAQRRPENRAGARTRSGARTHASTSAALGPLGTLLAGLALAGLTPALLAATRGPRGTIWLNEAGKLEETPAFPVQAVDTLGAGDVFHGAFTLGLAEGAEVREALRFAATAAALKCTRHGGGMAAPQRVEVEELLRGRL